MIVDIFNPERKQIPFTKKYIKDLVRIAKEGCGDEGCKKDGHECMWAKNKICYFDLEFQHVGEGIPFPILEARGVIKRLIGGS